MSVKITKDDTDKVLANIQKMAGARLLVGIPAEKAPRKGDPITNASLGYIHENGSSARNIPPRPFLVPGVRAATPKCIDVLKKAGKAALSEGPSALDKGLNAAGLIAQNVVKQRIRLQEGFAPLAEGTIKARKRKGFHGEKALIRTGQLMNSITYVVRGK